MNDFAASVVDKEQVDVETREGEALSVTAPAQDATGPLKDSLNATSATAPAGDSLASVDNPNRTTLQGQPGEGGFVDNGRTDAGGAIGSALAPGDTSGLGGEIEDLSEGTTQIISQEAAPANVPADFLQSVAQFQESKGQRLESESNAALPGKQRAVANGVAPV